MKRYRADLYSMEITEVEVTSTSEGNEVEVRFGGEIARFSIEKEEAGVRYFGYDSEAINWLGTNARGNVYYFNKEIEARQKQLKKIKEELKEFKKLLKKAKKVQKKVERLNDDGEIEKRRWW